MRVLTGRWIEWVAAVACGVTALFAWSNEQYGVAVIAGVCSGLVAGLQLGVWAGRR